MAKRAITILGGGNTGFATAAQLTLCGYEVALCELPEYKEAVAPIIENGAIHLAGVAKQGTAKLRMVTTDLAEALAISDTLLCIVPSYAHKAFALACAPHLRAGHTIVLMPGNLGSLEWARILREKQIDGVTMAEVETAPYVCRKTAPDTATIWGVVSSLGLGVLPTSETRRVLELMTPLFPGIRSYPDVLACGLSAGNPVVHPAGVILNAGRVEYSRGEFYFYEEGVSQSVAKVIMTLDQERRDIGKALGYDLLPVNESFHAAGFGPKGDLWATINGSLMLTRLKAPGVLNNRWLTEDIPYGIATWSRLGAQYGVQTPLMQAFVAIGSVIMGFDGWERSRSLEDLGIAGMDKRALKSYLESGKQG
ncbi:MAG: NAD/NADP octopine/nopaline dehydrogenase family protein [Spirochaetales bacterium]|nr:NAD/NADP octopine/nopaline dehydrogenase family protein [Spirochaetales bacterium]